VQRSSQSSGQKTGHSVLHYQLRWVLVRQL